jgi:hypothetical protein
MIKLIVTMLGILMLTGCSILSKNIAPAVAAYCAKPINERILIRELTAVEIAPNRVEVHCAGDVPVEE